MKRDLRELTFQKLQYEQQEAANRLLPDRTRVSIVNSTVGDEDGKSVVRYLVEVQQLAPDGSFASGWVVARRYNEFLNMHTKLRERYGLVRNLDFPGKRLVGALSGSFLDTRRVALEKYLQVSCGFSFTLPSFLIVRIECGLYTHCLRKRRPSRVPFSRVSLRRF
jgi:sorting nexin-25